MGAVNILYITGSSPIETSIGSSQRSHLLWNALKQCGTVYTVVPTGPSDDRVDDESERIHFASFFADNKLLLFVQLLIAKFGKGLDFPCRSLEFVREKIGWADVKFDLVVTRYVRNASVCSAWKIAPCVIDIDDLPIESFRTIQKPKCNKLIGELFDCLYRAWTGFVLRRTKAAWVPNEAQMEIVGKFCPCGVLPNLPLNPGGDYKMNGRQRHRLMTIGMMGYEPNYEGVDWFVTNIWPEIRKAFPDMIYSIGGKGAPAVYVDKWSGVDGVEVIGFVDDLDKLYESSLAVVTPINSGAGTCIKVLEACLRGRFVLATPFAVRGLTETMCGRLKMLVSKNADDYVNKLRTLTGFSPDRLVAEQHEISVRFGEMFSVDSFNRSVREMVERK